MDLFQTVTEGAMIRDSRPLADFKTATFSGYKKTEVRDLLVAALRNGKVENACYWSVELVCSGAFLELWETLLHVLGKYIHHGNPLMTHYYRRRYALFRAIMNDPQIYASPLELRNNVVMRRLFAELVSTVALSEKRPSYEELKTTDLVGEDGLLQIAARLKADRPDYAAAVFQEDDPRELVIFLNELCYHLQKSRSMNDACTWIEWVLQFAALCKGRGEPLFLEPRSGYDDVDKKFRKDPIWIVWELLLHVASVKSDGINAVMVSLFELFRIRYAGLSTCKKRKPLIYFAVSLLTEPVTIRAELATDKSKEVVRVVTENVDKIYEGLQPASTTATAATAATGTSVSFRTIEKRENLEDSLKKMELLSLIDTVVK